MPRAKACSAFALPFTRDRKRNRRDGADDSERPSERGTSGPPGRLFEERGWKGIAAVERTLVQWAGGGTATAVPLRGMETRNLISYA